MANNLTSNTVEQLARRFTEKWESSVVVTKTVDTSLLTPRLTPMSGGEVSIKRPARYKSVRTATGDITSSGTSDIIIGKATGVVQDYITVPIDWENIEEALELDQLDEILQPAVDECVTTLESSMVDYMMKNSGLLHGTVGTVADAWSDISGPKALMNSLGVPLAGKKYYLMNDFTTTGLADTQSGLSSGDNNLVTTAWQDAQISTPFAGMRAITSSNMAQLTSGSVSDRAGILAADPDVTYVTAKDTMTQQLSVSGFGAGADTIAAGEVIQITGRNRIQLNTKKAVLDATGAQILWTGVVTEAVTLSGGAGILTVAGPALFENATVTKGAFNTVDSAPLQNDVVTLLGSADTLYQPNLFYHEKAFGIGFVKLPKLFATDTVGTMKDGFSFRITKFSDGLANTQKYRVDILPAFVTFDPFFAGHGWGT